MLRLGLIGIGHGKTLINASCSEKLASQVQTTAICDINQTRLSAVSKEYGIKNTFTNYNDLVKSKDIDMVGIYSPGPIHADQILNALENGVIQSIPQNADEWPYQILLDAINDGWRIIKFPEQALLLNEDTSYGLGCEYVLEKIT